MRWFGRGRVAGLAVVVAAVAWGIVPAQVEGQDLTARSVVERAASLMGGEDVLRGAERVRFSMMTQWQRADFDREGFRDRPSFEVHHDVRDYTLPAWRNTRDFGARSITNVVVDSVATTDNGGGPQPLSVAYVDERDELFVYTPDRLVLALLDAPDLDLLGDTLVGGDRHRRLRARLAGRYPATVYFHAGSGLPTLLRFSAGHFADFGLVPWGEMDVDVWYSGWRSFDAVSIPTQWDIWRAGARYKRMTVRAADFAPDFVSADSFTVARETRTAYFGSSAVRPMHESMPIQEPIVHDGVVELPGFGAPAGAVDIGEGWLLLGAGQAGHTFDRVRDLLRPAGVGRVTGVLVAEGRISNGGVVRAVEEGLPVYVSPAAEPFVRRMLANGGVDDAQWVTIDAPRTLGSGEDRVVLAPVDLPDVPGALMLYRPALRWLWVPDAGTPLDVRVARERAEALGWAVDRVGMPRSMGLEQAAGAGAGGDR